MWIITFGIIIKSLCSETPWVRKKVYKSVSLPLVVGQNFQNYFLKKLKIAILISDSAHKALPIILLIFFD